MIRAHFCVNFMSVENNVEFKKRFTNFISINKSKKFARRQNEFNFLSILAKKSIKLLGLLSREKREFISYNK